MAISRPSLRRALGSAPAALPRLRPAADRGVFIHPSFRRIPPPVILIGVHRSGTSVVAGMLAALGVYMGSSLARYGEAASRLAPGEMPPFAGNGEAPEFYDLNEALLARAGGAWNRLEPFLAQRDEATFFRSGTWLLQGATFGPLRRSYLPGKPPGDGVWGWKDPRTSVTLPFWLRLFPDARILHVRRDPEAVARSLYRRAHDWSRLPQVRPGRRARLAAALRNHAAIGRRAARSLGLLPPAAADPDPCLNWDYCCRLGEQYLEECLRLRYRGAACHEIWYEAVVADPLAAAAELAAFTGAAAAPARLAHAAALVRRPGALLTGA
jgi:hypothetical protein